MNRITVILTFLAMLCIHCPAFPQDIFAPADSLLLTASDTEGASRMLTSMLATASGDKERCEIHWRLARVMTVIGETATDKEARRTAYSKGLGYAVTAINEDPSNPQGYMWHCACTGRECQTRPLMKQASYVPVMMRDLTCILDTLKAVDFSEAWQALAEIHYHHPFKSTDSGINFMRQAVLTIPPDELRLSSWLFFAEILYERNWSARKRAETIAADAEKYRLGTTNIEKYAFIDGKLGPRHTPPWCSRPFGTLSDREEAAAVLAYAAGLYRRAAYRSPQDEKDYEKLAAAAAHFNDGR